MLKTMVDIRNLVTLTSFIISTTIELASVIREGICGNFFFNERLFWNSYKKVYTPSNKIVKLSRTYTKVKSFSITRAAIQVSNPASGPLVPLLRFSTKLQQLLKKTKSHVTEMPPKILNQIFGRPKMQKSRETCVNGLNAKTVYDKTNKESSGAYYSSSQSSELRDTQQVLRQKEYAKMTKGMSTPEFSGELSTAIMLQRSYPEFIKTIFAYSW